MRHAALALYPALALFLLTGAAAAQRPGDSPPPREKGAGDGPKPVEVRRSDSKEPPIALGAEVDPKLGWVDLEGKPHALAELHGKTVVVFFVGTKSAASAAWGKRFARLAELYAERGVVALALDANAYDLRDASPEGRARLAKWAAEQGWKRFGLDPDRRLAERLAVATNGHVVVIDAARRFAFSGTLDDDFKGEHEARALRHARAALDALLAGKPAEPSSTPALGDPIARPPPGEAKRPPVPKEDPKPVPPPEPKPPTGG